MAMRKANRGKSLKTGSVLQNVWFEPTLPDHFNILNWLYLQPYFVVYI